jgi:hypothetical protein
LTLGHIFAKPKDPVKTNQKTHAVYSIPCGDCEKEYLGQSKRQFGTRLKEHQKAVYQSSERNMIDIELYQHSWKLRKLSLSQFPLVLILTVYISTRKMFYIC